MLLYPGTGTEALPESYLITQDKVEMVLLKAEEINGEHQVRSWGYELILWLVSFWAMVTNSAQALAIKVFKRPKQSLKRILWEMGRDPDHVSSIFVDRFSYYSALSKIGAASWRSLELFYNYHEKIEPQLDDSIGDALARFWIGKMENRQAVTNRKKAVVGLLDKALHRFINEPEIRIISIASGSAQAVIEAIQKNPALPVYATLLDIDEVALQRAKMQVEKAGLSNRFRFVRGTTSALETICREKPHIIEMVGFLDYRPDVKAIKLIAQLRNFLAENGILLTCNIRKNRERIFLNWVLLWPMIYRDEKQLANLLIKGGFEPSKINLIYEPFKIHGIAVCQK